MARVKDYAHTEVAITIGIIITVIGLLIFSEISFYGNGKQKKHKKDKDEIVFVNKEKELSKENKPNIIAFRNSKIDTSVKEELDAMMKSAGRDFVQLIIEKGYVSKEEQALAYQNTINRLIDEGNTYADALKKVELEIAKPNYSEHQTGLAIDFGYELDKSVEQKMWNWLEVHAYKYGFVKRYPSDKEKVTGYPTNKKHYRYVGKDIAAKMVEENLCLEEYQTQKGKKAF